MNLGPWLGDFYGIKPHKDKHNNSFNNVVFSTEYILARMEAKTLTHDEIKLYIRHIDLTADEDGGYAPKNSHDNLTAKIVGLQALKSNRVNGMNIAKLSKGKHPRDRIIYGTLMTKNPLWWLLLPLAMFDMVRAIKSKGKVRPKWFGDKSFLFRLKAKFGFLKMTAKQYIFGGEMRFYKSGQDVLSMRIVQNDGKILNLLRLNAMRHYKVLKPFVRYCKRLYIKQYGAKFQSYLMSNDFEEPNHPVRVAFKELEALDKTIIDCK